MYEWAELHKTAGIENLGTWCMSEDKREVMKLLGCDEKYDQGRSSDFEQLAEWERILPLCAGMGSVVLYQKQLSLLGIHEHKSSNIFDLWREGNRKLEESDFTKKYDDMIENQGIDVFSVMMNYAKSKKEGFQETLLKTKRLFSESKADVTLRLDAEDLCYARPDRYHAELYWQRLLCDEKLKKEEIFVLRFQSLIEVLLCLKEQNISVSLHFRSSNSELRERMISYLQMYHLMTGELRFSVVCDEPASRFLPLCLRSDSELRILPELLLRPSDVGDALALALQTWSAAFPIGGLRYCGLVTDSFSMALAAREVLSETIDSLLLRFDLYDEKRQEIIDTVLNS